MAADLDARSSVGAQVVGVVDRPEASHSTFRSSAREGVDVDHRSLPWLPRAPRDAERGQGMLSMRPVPPPLPSRSVP